MSSFVQSLKGHELSYEAREASCHAIEMYVNRLRLGADNLKVRKLFIKFLISLFYFYCCFTSWQYI